MTRCCAALLAWLLVLGAGPALACPARVFEPLNQGQWLRDPDSGLIWQRCLVGQQWREGRCHNDDARAQVPGKQLSYREAMREALRQNEREADPARPWRVPREAEWLGLQAACPSLLPEQWFPVTTFWPADTRLWLAGPFDLKRGVQVIGVHDRQTHWVPYGDQELHPLLLVR